MSANVNMNMSANANANANANGLTPQAVLESYRRAKARRAVWESHWKKGYASIAYLKDVEERLTGHLIRIEEKLDLTRGARAGGGQ